MNVLWLVTNPRENPSTRFRVLQYLEGLQQRGIDVTVKSLLTSPYYLSARRAGAFGDKFWPLLKYSLSRLRDVLLAFEYDAVVVLREVYPFGPSVLERLLVWTNPNVIFDFDDAVYERFEKVNNPLDRFRDFDKTQKLIQRSRLTVAGSRTLEAYALQYTPEVEWIPTVVDTDYYRPDPSRRRSGPVVIGWMGTRNNLLHLELAKEALRELQAQFGVKLRVVCDTDYRAEGLEVENLRWSEGRERELLQSFDIGIMPLYDDAYSRGKCAFKLIQYLANGLPSVCSPVGENTRVVKDGETGFLAGSRDEWVDKIGRLISDPQLGRELGGRGRRLVEEQFSLKVGLKKWAAVFSNIESTRKK